MKWKKLGKLFDPLVYYGLKKDEWFSSHAQNPFIEMLDRNGLARVHFATRDTSNRSRGAYVDINLDDPFAILNIAQKPTLDLGPLGAFDDSGAMPHCILDVGDKKYLYYTGWSKCVDVPFSFHIGLAISEDNGKTYQKHSLAPVIGRNIHDPFIVGAPFVLHDEAGFKMWYISATKWLSDPKTHSPVHYYTIKSASSNDGINWETNSALCLDYDSTEHAIARPVVRKLSSEYEMWFSVRNIDTRYRIERATSSDGVSWSRERKNCLEASDQGWDSEMLCYAFPFEHKNKQYMLYNGNNYGQEGFGLAVME